MARIDDFRTMVGRYQSACAQGEMDQATEETTRAWINEMLGIFGWDVRNVRQVKQETRLRAVERDALVRIGSTNTRPDYTMCNGEVRLFFLDAKRRSVNIREDSDVAFQIRSYGWSSGAAYSVVTNIDEIAIYDCSTMPRHTEAANFARALYLTIDEFIDNYEQINDYLGREESIRSRNVIGNNGYESIDKQFSKMLRRIRLGLAESIVAGCGQRVSITDLNLWTQIILNRILFIRVCEANGLEQDGLLRGFGQRGFWEHFKESSYLAFYEHYDGPLFARVRQIHELNIGNQVFDELLSNLYYPSPYCFEVIPLKSISDIYDLFLGYHLEYDEAGNIIDVVKSEFRKSNGAVTTPEHIMQNTIRSTIMPLKLSTLTSQQILNLKILDPACGSGVFLVGIYDLLAEQITLNINSGDTSLPEQYFYVKDGERCLNLDGRKMIVNRCIHGVDINQECVEVAKLSLSLKIINGFEPAHHHEAGLNGHQILNGVGANIRCGNALVGPDIMDIVPSIRENVVECAETNIFDWQEAFGEVLNNGGFDYVIGNPPYVEVKNYNVALPHMAEYIKCRYASSRNGKIDLAIPFLERGVELLNPHGALGYIVQKRFFKTDYGKGIRRLLSEQRLLRSVYDYEETDLFEGRITYVAIVVCDKATVADDTFDYTNSIANECVSMPKSAFTETPWSFDSVSTTALRQRIANSHGTLKDVCNIKVGVQVLWDRAYHVRVRQIDEHYIYGSTELCENVRLERGACRTLLCNEHFVPLSKQSTTTCILFPYDMVQGKSRGIPFSEYRRRYPLAGAYLQTYRAIIENAVQTVPDKKPFVERDEYWHLFTRANNHNAVYRKLCIPMTAQEPQASVVEQEDAYCDNANMFFAQLDRPTDNRLYALAAIINSTPFSFFAKSIANPQQGNFYKFNKQFLDPVPFPREAFNSETETICRLAVVAQRIEEANAANDPRLRPLLASLWNELDALCCELYGLTEEEKATIMSHHRNDR